MHTGSYEEGYRAYLFDFQSWETVSAFRGKNVEQRLQLMFPNCRMGSEAEPGSCAHGLREVYDAILSAYSTSSDEKGEEDGGFSWD